MHSIIKYINRRIPICIDSEIKAIGLYKTYVVIRSSTMNDSPAERGHNVNVNRVQWSIPTLPNHRLIVTHVMLQVLRTTLSTERIHHTKYDFYNLYADFSLLYMGATAPAHRWSVLCLRRLYISNFHALMAYECEALSISVHQSTIKHPRASLIFFAWKNSVKGAAIGYYYGSMVLVTSVVFHYITVLTRRVLWV